MKSTSSADQRIPITLLTGFLGSGKTTLVNRILSNPNSDKIAVIVNEFGEIGIDGDLISRASDDMLELSNGCICCSSKDDLTEALYKLYMRKAGLVEPKIDFDRILIETTGLANPLPLAQAFYTDMSLSLTYRLDAIVTVVDVKHIQIQLKDCPEAERQIALADKIILNKKDLVSEAEFAQASGVVASLNPYAPKETVSFSEVDVNAMLGSGLFDPTASDADVCRWIGAVETEPCEHDRHQCHECDDHHHHSEVSAVSLREPRELDYQAFMKFLERVTHSYGTDLYRIKGLISFSGVTKPVILQGVQNVFSPLSYADAWPNDTAENRLVIIGKGLVRDSLKHQFEACLAEKNAVLDRTLSMI